MACTLNAMLESEQNGEKVWKKNEKSLWPLDTIQKAIEPMKPINAAVHIRIHCTHIQIHKLFFSFIYLSRWARKFWNYAYCRFAQSPSFEEVKEKPVYQNRACIPFDIHYMCVRVCRSKMLRIACFPIHAKFNTKRLAFISRYKTM